MAKVDLELLRELQIVAREGLAIWDEASRLLIAQGQFCDYCGETKPKSGFYPLIASGSGSITGLMCNDCDRKIREKYKRKKDGKTEAF